MSKILESLAVIDEQKWRKIRTYTLENLAKKYDSSVLFEEESEFRNKCVQGHRGFFVSFINTKGEEVVREGFLRDNNDTNVLDSCDLILDALYNKLRSSDVSLSGLRSGKLAFCLVLDAQYMPDPTQWDDSKDGVYFQWGQDYRAFYLPYQIERMNQTKVGILDQLCQKEAGLCSNLWREPEGLCFKLICNSYAL